PPRSVEEARAAAAPPSRPAEAPKPQPSRPLPPPIPVTPRAPLPARPQPRKPPQPAATPILDVLEKRWKAFKDGVDWELFTGAKLFAWLGGLALFLAAGFFVKYSIDKNLIAPEIRLSIAASVGALLVAVSFRFAKGR